MQKAKMEIADLLADESFINYCKNSSPQDTAFWENYIIQNPSQREVVELARERFTLLFTILADADREEQAERLRNKLNQKDIAPVIKMGDWAEKEPGKKTPLWLKLAGIAAVFLLLVFFSIRYFTSSNNSVKTFATSLGERKNIQLPDGSVVNLNAGSAITIDEHFGITSRDVYLKGEAFFDVKHDTNTPFIVHTPAMDVKALGTAFDVKAYENEKLTETSLIRGLIEVTLKEHDNQVLLLHPNQKIAWQQEFAEVGNNNSGKLKKKEINVQQSMPKNIKATDHGDIKEIAWKENKLIFEDDSFSNIAALLERWYGVRIEFLDEPVRNYRFTGVYEKEDLKTVLAFMQESKAFNFNITAGDTVVVTLSK
ncbi:MAG: FecR domain-containing protein [Chitinophagaceae bacterium]|nr:FecR domain-containing protein [Chitinophagaceae bacterium]